MTKIPGPIEILPIVNTALDRDRELITYITYEYRMIEGTIPMETPIRLDDALAEIDPTFVTGLDVDVSYVMRSWPKFFQDIRSGRKSFDLRKTKEGRRFQESQYVLAREWDPETEEYSGLWDLYFITYILFSEDAEQFGFEGGLGGDILEVKIVTGN